MVYADFESTLIKLRPVPGEETTSQKLAEHVPNSVGMYFVCTFDSTRNFYKQFNGDGCVVSFMLELQNLADKCIEEMQDNERMVITKEEERAFRKATSCHICKQCLNDDEPKNRRECVIMTTARVNTVVLPMRSATFNTTPTDSYPWSCTI